MFGSIVLISHLWPMRARTRLTRLTFRIKHHDEWITIIQMKWICRLEEREKKKWWTQRILSIFDFSSYPSFICGFVISLLFVTHQLKRTFRNSEPVYFPLSKPFGAFLLGLANWRVFNCPTWRTQCIKWSFSFHGEKIPGHTEMWIIEFCTLWLMVLCRHGIELNDLQCSLEYRNFYWF